MAKQKGRCGAGDLQQVHGPETHIPFHANWDKLSKTRKSATTAQVNDCLASP